MIETILCITEGKCHTWHPGILLMKVSFYVAGRECVFLCRIIIDNNDISLYCSWWELSLISCADDSDTPLYCRRLWVVPHHCYHLLMTAVSFWRSVGECSNCLTSSIADHFDDVPGSQSVSVLCLFYLITKTNSPFQGVSTSLHHLTLTPTTVSVL